MTVRQGYQKPSVIIVDDDVLVLQTLHDTLEDTCDIYTTETPADVLKRLQEQSYDILITDYMMPQCSGITLIKEAKLICPSILPIIATGYANKDIALDALRHGAYDFIEKPIFPEILMASVNRAWDQIKAINDNKKLLEDIKVYTLKLEEQNRSLDSKNKELQLTKMALEDNNIKLENQYSELEKAQAEVQRNAMKAGMAEVSINILHNVGNILNSVNVSANVLSENLNSSKAKILFNVIELLEQNEKNIATFLTENNKGRLALSLLKEVKAAMQDEKNVSSKELRRLSNNVDHIKAIIALQQGYSAQPLFKEEHSLLHLVDDALVLLEGELNTSAIEIIFLDRDDTILVLSKHKMLLILINLIRNAKDSILEAKPSSRQIKISVTANPPTITIEDNGSGIAQKNLSKIFTHGFTTKKTGHGFGLNSCAVAIQELDGKIEAFSNGIGKGAKFIITF